jgi:hypothetical protein
MKENTEPTKGRTSIEDVVICQITTLLLFSKF